MRRLFPIVETLKGYDRSWLRLDIAAALTVWAIVVPESMAYAGIAGMPPETGLYGAGILLLVYAAMGSSNRMTVGPSAAVAALSAATIAPFAAAGSDAFVSLTVTLAIITGVLLILGGIGRLGIISEFLSEPVLKGFIVGVAMTIVLGQADKLFRLETEGEGFFAELWDLATNLGDLHGTTLLVGLSCLVVLFLLDWLLPRVPAALVVVVGSIAAVGALDLESAGVMITGEIAAGLPSLGLPEVSWRAVTGLVPGAIGLAIVVYGESMALAKTFGARHGERVDANRELYALGAANAVTGLFGGFVGNGSNSRTAAADSAGQKSQVSGVIVVALVVVTILFLTPLFHDLPEAALGAIVIHAVWHLITFKPFPKLHRLNRVDYWAAVLTLLGVLTLDVLAGLMIGVVVSLGGLMARAARPRTAWLGRDEESGEYRRLGEATVAEVPGVAILRFEEELFFANASVLRDTVLSRVDEATEPIGVVLDARAITNVDTTAAVELGDLIEELAKRGSRFATARAVGPLVASLQASGVDISPMSYPSVHEAVAAVARQNID